MFSLTFDSLIKDREYLMNEQESFSDLVYEEQSHLAERELSSFIEAVTELYGPEQARVSARDWLDESDSMDSPPFSTEREWRAVTIAASARLARRLAMQVRRQNSISF